MMKTRVTLRNVYLLIRKRDNVQRKSFHEDILRASASEPTTTKPIAQTATGFNTSFIDVDLVPESHTDIRDSSKKFNIVESDTCDCGNARQTANHVLWQCCRFDSPRELLIRDLIIQKIFPPYCIEMFLHNMGQSLISIVRFINSTGIYILKKWKIM
jgi:hypothetical protein